jgi:hypothetical protein
VIKNAVVQRVSLIGDWDAEVFHTMLMIMVVAPRGRSCASGQRAGCCG